MDRPSWLEYFKQIVSVTATRSPCERLQVGCLLVKDNHEQATVHAEQNAITDCAKRGVSCNNAEAYITHYPCVNCMKMLCASGIKKIYYINDYKNNELVEYFFQESFVQELKQI